MDNKVETEVKPKVNSNKNILIIVGVSVVIILLVVVAGLIILSNSDSGNNETSLLPENTCPDQLNNTGGKPSAIYKGKTVEMSKEVYDWVVANCEDEFNAGIPEPVITNLGVTFGEYDEQTGRAGSFIFDKVALKTNIPSNKIFFEFGAKLTTTDGTKTFPELIYNQVDADTDVTALADGTVFKISKQNESNDFSLEIRYNDNWMFIYDHVTSLNVAEGEKIKAGEAIGKVSLNRDETTGFTEIQIKEGSGRSTTTNHCPLKFLRDDLKLSFEEKITRLMSDWEAFFGDRNIYDQSTQRFPGCVLDSIKD